MTKKYFSLPYVFLYSLIIAGVDSLLGIVSSRDSFSFETYCMRAIVIFAYWLLIRLVAERAERRGHSYRKYMYLTAVLFPLMLIFLSFVIA